MIPKKQSLSTQIKKVIGNRILFCSFAFMFIILALTAYDLSVSIDQLRARINDRVKPIEDFTIGQVMIDNVRTIDLKISSFNDNNSTFKIEWIPNGNTTYNSIMWKLPFSWVYDYKLGNIAGYSFGYFKVTGSFLSDKTLVYDLIIRLILLIIFILTILSILYPLAKKIPEKLFIDPINRFIDLISNPETEKFEISKMLPIELNVLETKILTLLNQAKQFERDKAIIELGHLATQVAHDIRSPLIVLNIETVDLFLIPEKKRIAIRNAIQRVNDIANNLLSLYKKDNTKNSSTTFFSSEPVAIMLDSIVSEKRIQASNSSIQINLVIAQNAYTAFINVDITEFKRTLSNIINNAIEAINESGIVTVKLTKTIDKIIIDVIDTGCGIPKDKLHLVLEEGVSFGKKSGSGLGLPYAINKIYSWGGDYSLTSDLEEGTHFEIVLPQSEPASWFAHNITIPQNSTLVVLDDDESIHNILSQRFSEEITEINKISLIHFYTPEELIKYCKKSQRNMNTIFLLDYELADHNKNGLELAEMLSITNYSILATSRYEDIKIKETCLKLKMKMMPKPFVKIAFINILKKVDLIFIDDDESMTDIWKDKAKLVGKNIDIFNNIRDFMHIFHLYDKNTLIYIDSSLGENLKGEDFAKVLYDHHYQNIILATGYDRESFKKPYWLKDVVDKYPPF